MYSQNIIQPKKNKYCYHKMNIPDIKFSTFILNSSLDDLMDISRKKIKKLVGIHNRVYIFYNYYNELKDGRMFGYQSFLSDIIYELYMYHGDINIDMPLSLDAILNKYSHVILDDPYADHDNVLSAIKTLKKYKEKNLISLYSHTIKRPREKGSRQLLNEDILRRLRDFI